MTFGNGSYVQYTYDLYERLTQEQCYNKNGALTQTKHYVYNSEGILSETYLTNASGAVTQRFLFEYDTLGRLIRSSQTNGSTVVQSTEHIYDENNRVTKQTYILGSTSEKTERYTYDSTNGNLTETYLGTGRSMYHSYDELQRLIGDRLDGIYQRGYTFKVLSTSRTTTQVRKITYAGDGSSWTSSSYVYDYDDMGNITSVTGPQGSGTGGTTNRSDTYYYDGQNQLIAEEQDTVSLEYHYDTAGNIQRVDAAGATWKQFTYGNSQWRDLLTQVTINGTTGNITYETGPSGDTIGNPLTYYNGTNWNFTWQNGRQLATATTSGKNLSFTYGVDGLRTSKTVNGVTYNYLYLNGRVAQQTWTENGTSHTMTFYYDAQGRPVAVYYDGVAHYYETNQQGDVIKIYRVIKENGELKITLVATYSYDAWGNVTVHRTSSIDTANIGNLNPIRYRGYYQDTETGFYYLQSRYYDPVVYRFINADNQLVLGLLDKQNIFGYCNNNPVNYADFGGNSPAGALAGELVAAGGLALADGPLPFGEILLLAVIIKAAAEIKTISSKNEEKSHTVYRLVDAGGNTLYVGRTVNPDKRRDAHRLNPARRDLDFVVIQSGLTASAARGLEQMYMQHYQTINTANKASNQINGISPTNPRLEQYMNDARNALRYAENIFTNEVLYWCGS